MGEKEKITKFKEDMQKRVIAECEEIKKADKPRKELSNYIRNLRWESPELAAYLKKTASIVLDFDN